MTTTHEWKSGNRLDSVMNVLLIVLALSTLSAGSLQGEPATTQLTVNTVKVA